MYRICFECVHYGEGFGDLLSGRPTMHHGCTRLTERCTLDKGFPDYEKEVDSEKFADRIIDRLKYGIRIEETPIHEPKQSTQ